MRERYKDLFYDDDDDDYGKNEPEKHEEEEKLKENTINNFLGIEWEVLFLIFSHG